MSVFISFHKTDIFYQLQILILQKIRALYIVKIKNPDQGSPWQWSLMCK